MHTNLGLLPNMLQLATALIEQNETTRLLSGSQCRTENRKDSEYIKRLCCLMNVSFISPKMWAIETTVGLLYILYMHIAQQARNFLSTIIRVVCTRMLKYKLGRGGNSIEYESIDLNAYLLIHSFAYEKTIINIGRRTFSSEKFVWSVRLDGKNAAHFSIVRLPHEIYWIWLKYRRILEEFFWGFSLLDSPSKSQKVVEKIALWKNSSIRHRDDLDWNNFI